MSEIKHECGIFGAYSLRNHDQRNLVPTVLEGLRHLKHRGQNAAGVSWIVRGTRGNVIQVYKDTGHVEDVFPDPQQVTQDYTQCALAHTRYATSGNVPQRAQPHLNLERTLAIAMNGNIANFEDLAKMCEGVDIELILRLFIEKMQTQSRVYFRNVFRGLEGDLDGAFNLALLRATHGHSVPSLLAYRDQSGNRPLGFTEVDELLVVSSEDSAIHQIWPGADVEDVPPGHMLKAQGSRWSLTEVINDPSLAGCFFEDVYFKNVHSKGVLDFRRQTAEVLARSDPQFRGKRTQYSVLPVPESSKSGANRYARVLGLPTNHDIIRRNPDHSGREFIGGQDSLDPKHIVDVSKLTGGKWIIFEDSLVRCRTLLRLLKDIQRANPHEIHVRINCPPILAPCYYGIDTRELEELFAPPFFDYQTLQSETLPPAVLEKMAHELGITSIKYLPVEAVPEALGVPMDELCMACVRGEYPTPKGQQLYDLNLKKIKQES